MDSVRSGRSSWLRNVEWIAMRTIARCESPWIRFAAQFGTSVVMPGDEVLQGRDEDVSWDGLRPLSSCTPEVQRQLRRRENMRKMVCVGTESAKQTRPELVMEALLRAFSGAREMVRVDCGHQSWLSPLRVVLLSFLRSVIQVCG